MSNLTRPNLPLKDITVLDVSRALAGPFCTMILGDLGADVIKIERPGSGDETRQWGPPFHDGESAYFLSANRNKMSVTLDLEAEEGQRVLHALVGEADVFVENFRPGVAEKLGASFQRLTAINPSLVYCSISGYGQDSPSAEAPAYDIIMQAIGGFMAITGEPERPPVRVGVAITDIVSGMYAALSILAALKTNRQARKATRIDISLLDATASLMSYLAQYLFLTNEKPKKMGSAHPTIVPYQAFRTLDDEYVVIAITNEKFWNIFCSLLGLKQVADDPRFATNRDRVKHRDELLEILEREFQLKSRDEWLPLLTDAGIPCGPVNDLSDVFAMKPIMFREMVVEVPHPGGRVRILGSPMKASPSVTHIGRPPPLLGEHTTEVLKSLLGYTDSQIETLRSKGIV